MTELEQIGFKYMPEISSKHVSLWLGNNRYLLLDESGLHLKQNTHHNGNIYIESVCIHNHSDGELKAEKVKQLIELLSFKNVKAS